MSVKAYDVIGNQWFTAIPTATAISGTAAAAAFVGSLTLPVPFNCKLISAYRMNTTGKTDAVAAMTLTVSKIAGGTGTITALGTWIYNGTQASNKTEVLTAVSTGTAAHLNAGDIVGIANVTGTVAATQTQAFGISFAEILE